MHAVQATEVDGFRRRQRGKLPQNRFSGGWRDNLQRYKDHAIDGYTMAVVMGWGWMVENLLSYARSRARSDLKETPDSLLGRVGQDVNLVGVMLTIGIAAIVGYAIIFASAETESSINVADGSGFDNASSSLTAGLESAFSLVEVAFIALILAVVIGAFLLLQGRRRGPE